MQVSTSALRREIGFTRLTQYLRWFVKQEGLIVNFRSRGDKLGKTKVGGV